MFRSSIFYLNSPVSSSTWMLTSGVGIKRAFCWHEMLVFSFHFCMYSCSKEEKLFLAFIPTITTINRRLQVHVCYSCAASRRSSTWQLHRTGHTWNQGGRGGALPRVLWCQSCSSRFFHRRHSSTICPHLSTSYRLSEPPVPPPILKQKNI